MTSNIMAVDFSVECALPYTNDLDVQQENFLSVFNELSDRLKAEGKQFVQTLLVDDMTNSATEGYDLDAYVIVCTKNYPGVLILRESLLQKIADKIYADLEVELGQGQLAELKNARGYSSAFYIAVWTLLRLGYITDSIFPSDHIAGRIINILPESFRVDDEASLEIIKKTMFPQAVDQVEYVYVQD